MDRTPIDMPIDASTAPPTAPRTTTPVEASTAPGAEAGPPLGPPLEPPPRRPTHDGLDGLDVPLERDRFLRTLLRELAGTLQEVVGLDEASGFVSVVGQNMGRQMDHDYRTALGVARLTRDQVADVLVDLKARIQGAFFVAALDDDRIVFGNRACPFAETVLGRPALCMMTSNVFGSIAAENLGYAKVELQETIAAGHPGCRVIVHLRATPDADAAPGREYFGGDPR